MSAARKPKPKPAAKTTARKSAVQARSRSTVEALLAATERVLVRDGYDRASTNKIAEAAGVSVGSLYQYFPSKEALVAAVIHRHNAAMLELVRTSLARVATLPPYETARELVRAMIEAHRLAPRLHRVLVEQTPRVGSLEILEQLEDEVVTLIHGHLESRRELLRVRDVGMSAFIVTRAVEAMTHAAVLRRPELLDDPRFVDEVADLVARYVARAAFVPEDASPEE